MKLTNYLRAKLLIFVCWLEWRMKRDPDFTLNDPEWNELQNEVNGLKRDLKKKEVRDGSGS